MRFYIILQKFFCRFRYFETICSEFERFVTVWKVMETTEDFLDFGRDFRRFFEI